MKSETLKGLEESPRPSSSVSNISGRLSKQSLFRSNDLKTFERQTVMTPQGFKTVKIYTATEEEKNSMRKYSQRPRTALGITSSMDQNKLSIGSERLLQRASSAKVLRSANRQPQLEIDRPSTAASSASSSISSSQSSSSRQIVYNSRHPMCSPVNLYLQDDLRSEARKNRPSSAPYECDECSSVERYNNVRLKKRAKSADVVERFGTRVQCPKYVRNNSFLKHDELDVGQKQYIWGMARVYSVDQLKSLRQRHYQSILNYEYIKRVITRGVEDKDRVKLQKEYMEYQKVIDRFGKNDGRLRTTSCPSSYMKPHTHAKKHRITGWTTEVTDKSSQISNVSDGFDSLNDDSFIYSDDGSGTTADEKPTMLDEKLCTNRGYGNDRPKSSKYKMRKPIAMSTSTNEQMKIVTEDLSVEETLSRDVDDKLIINSPDENFI